MPPVPPLHVEFELVTPSASEPAASFKAACDEARSLFAAASAQHSGILHCALRSDQQQADPSATRKLAKAAQPFKFCFVFAENDAQLVELVSKHVAANKGAALQEASPGAAAVAAAAASDAPALRWCYALAAMAPPSAETVLALVEALQIPQQDNAKTGVAAVAASTSASSVSNILVALPPDRTSPCWIIEAPSAPATAAVATAATAATSTDASSSLSLADRMWTACLQRSGLNVLVGFWYGSQSGNAEYICTQLHHAFLCERGAKQPAAVRDFVKRSQCAAAAAAGKPGNPCAGAGSVVLLDTLNGFVKKDMLGDAVLHRYTCIHVFICSTHGDGDFPDNANRVKKYLSTRCAQNKTAIAAARLFFSVLALGDTNYSKFCEAGKLLNRKLKELGATCMLPIRTADDGIGLELVVDPFVETEIWPPLERQIVTLLTEHAVETPLASPLLTQSGRGAASAFGGAVPDDGGSATADAAKQTTAASAAPAAAASSYYEVSSLILFSPSALTHAGVLQSVLVNAGMHEPGSLPVLLPLRLLFDGGDKKHEPHDQFPSAVVASAGAATAASPSGGAGGGTPQSPFSQKLAATMQFQRVPAAKNLFIIASSDAAWWDEAAASTNGAPPPSAHQHHRVCSHIAQVCSNVKLFAYFDIDQTLSKNLEQSRAAAAAAFHLPSKAESFDFLHLQQQRREESDAAGAAEQQVFHCGFTPWLRSLARWLVPRTIGKAASERRIVDAVISVVDSVVHGHHDRGLFLPALDAAVLGGNDDGGAVVASARPSPSNAGAGSAAARGNGGGGEALHILSLKRTVVFFSRTTLEEQLQQQQLASAPASSSSSSGQKQQSMLMDPALRGQSLAEDVARGVAASVLHGLDVDAAEIGHFRQAGFPRKAVFVFVLGPDMSKGVRRLIDHVTGIMALTSRQQSGKDQAETADAAAAAASTQAKRTFPLSGMSFAIFAIEWMHRAAHEYGGALELELVLQEAGATKIHPTGLARTGAIDPVLAKWRRSLKRSVEMCNTTTGYFEPAVANVADSAAAHNNSSSGSGKKVVTPVLVDMMGRRDVSALSLSEQQAGALAHNPLKGVSPSPKSQRRNSGGVEEDSTGTPTTSDEDRDAAEAGSGPASATAAAAGVAVDHSGGAAGNSRAVVSAMAAPSWDQFISLRPTPAALTARTDVSIVVTHSSTGFANIFARRCANEARVLGYNIVFVGTISRAEEFLALPTSNAVLVCGTKAPRRLLTGLARLARGRSDVLSHLSFACIGVSSTPLTAAPGDPQRMLVVPGAQLAVVLEGSCGAHRVFPSALVDSPSAAETKGTMWLRGTLGALARVVSRRSFLRAQNLSAVPTNNAGDSEGAGGAERVMAFLHSGTALTESMARDMAEEAAARGFQPRLLPLGAFRELVAVSAPASEGSPAASTRFSVDASCVVALCDETTPASLRALSRLVASLARTQLLSGAGAKLSKQQRAATATCVLAVVDRRLVSAAAAATSPSPAAAVANASPSAMLAAAFDRAFAVHLCPRATADVSDAGCISAINVFREDFFNRAIKHVAALMQQRQLPAAAPAIAAPAPAKTGSTIIDGASSQAQTQGAQPPRKEVSFFEPADNQLVASSSSSSVAAAAATAADASASPDEGWFYGRLVETYPLTSEVTNPPVVFAVFEAYQQPASAGGAVDPYQSAMASRAAMVKRAKKQLEWTPGDAVQIMPENDPREVDAILGMLHLSGDEPFLPPWDPRVSDSRFPSAPVYRNMRFTPSADENSGSGSSGAAPPALTVRDVLARYLSLRVHNKEVCNMMERHVTDPQHRAVLRALAGGGNASATSASASAPPAPTTAGGGGAPSAHGGGDSPTAANAAASAAALAALTGRRDIPLVDVLQLIRESVRHIPFRGFVESLPALQPRCYSITTAPLAHPNLIGIAFKVTARGVCTNWLLRLCERAAAAAAEQQPHVVVDVAMKLRPAPEFRMPADAATPMVLIGPGTGVAPFLSFLSHREAIQMATNQGDGNNGDEHAAAAAQPQTPSPLGDIHLYFGCRSKYHDFLFQEELLSFREGGVLTTLNTAFSQDCNGGAWFGGLYVQDLLRESGPALCRILASPLQEGGGHVYVCGDATSMAGAVSRVLLDLLVDGRGLSQQQAADVLERCRLEGRYQVDIW